MKVLFTGFGPFLNYKTNPTEILVKEFDKVTINRAKIIGSVIQVKHKDSGRKIVSLIKRHKPDAIVGTGLYATKSMIMLERIALNRFYFRDKEGKEYDEPITSDGPLAYSSTLPLTSIKKRLERNGIPAEFSFSADTYVSNEVFYNLMKTANKSGIRIAGFIHLPLTHRMVTQMQSVHPITRSNLPSMDYRTIEKAIEIVLAETIKAVKMRKS